MKQRVLILCGGRSDEHEISLISAHGILGALDRNLFEPLVVGISKKGVWHLHTDSKYFTVGEIRADKIALNESTPTISLQPFLNENGTGRLYSEGRAIDFDLAFPILHGPFGEDGTIQGLLDTIQIPYVGSKCGASWVCMDKAVTKSICEKQGIPVTPSVVIQRISELDPLMEQIHAFGFPLFVKPARLGSSVGISRITSSVELRLAVDQALKYDTKCLIEKGIVGRELECGVLGKSHDAKATLPAEIIPPPDIGWYSYDAKYLNASSQTIVPAQLKPEVQSRIQKFSLDAYRALECDGMARVDLFLIDQTDEIFLSEVNTIPGFTPISLYPKMWQASGIAYSDLITKLSDET